MGLAGYGYANAIYADIYKEKSIETLRKLVFVDFSFFVFLITQSLYL